MSLITLGFSSEVLDVVNFRGIEGEIIEEIKDSGVVGHRITASSYALA